MSRFAKIPISIPDGVQIQIEIGSIKVKGPKGELSFNLIPGVEVIEKKGILKVCIINGILVTKHLIAMSGTTRSIINNLIIGVSEGFKKHLTIIGVGYRAQAHGEKLHLSLGRSHPIVYKIPKGITGETPTPTDIVLRGADKQLLGQVAAEIRAYRPPEPYKGKGIRYLNEHVIRKQAKKK